MSVVLKKGTATIYVSDIDRAVKFYSNVLGMRVKSHFSKDYAELEMPGLTIGLHPPTKSGPPPGSSGSISLGFLVDDLDSVVSNLKGQGVEFRGNVIDDGPVKLAFFGDPDGNSLYLTQMKKDMWS